MINSLDNDIQAWKGANPDIPIRHFQRVYSTQFEYLDQLSDLAKIEKVPSYLKQGWELTFKNV